jgi:hypothetical protein
MNCYTAYLFFYFTKYKELFITRKLQKKNAKDWKVFFPKRPRQGEDCMMTNGIWHERNIFVGTWWEKELFCVRVASSDAFFPFFFSSPAHTSAYQNIQVFCAKCVHVIEKGALIKRSRIACERATVLLVFIYCAVQPRPVHSPDSSLHDFSYSLQTWTHMQIFLCATLWYFFPISQDFKWVWVRVIKEWLSRMERKTNVKEVSDDVWWHVY